MERYQSIGDLLTPDTLYLSFVGSTVPSGSIDRIHPPEGSKDLHLFTAADIPGEKHVTAFGSPVPILADNRVNYTGEPVLLIASNNRDTLYGGIKKIRIEYDTDYTIKKLENPDENSIFRVKHYRRGNSAKALQEAARILEEEYRFPGIPPRRCGSIGPGPGTSRGVSLSISPPAGSSIRPKRLPGRWE